MDMKFRTISRHLREGAKSVIRNGWMSFASISAIAISLFILGVFLLLALNVDKLASEVEDQVEIHAYLDETVQEDQVKSIWNEIGSLEGVHQVEFVSKEEGLEIMKERFGPEHADVLEGYEGDNNPLPDSFVVKVEDPLAIADVAKSIKKKYEMQSPPPVYDVKYGEGTVEALFKFTRAVRNVGLILVVGLAFTAMFLIANTIKLTIHARSREISIMKMVGATNSFIRWPFFIEGLLLGIIGSIIPIALLLYAYSTLVKTMQLELGMLMTQLFSVNEIGFKIALLLLGIGVVIGVWGSTISVRKFLKV